MDNTSKLDVSEIEDFQLPSRSDPLYDTLRFFQVGRPNCTSKDIHSQMGVHFEEVREMLEPLEALTPETGAIIQAADDALLALANHLKQNDGVIVIRHTSRQLMLDALCDQIVTATGVAHTLHMDIYGGMSEVSGSNLSKFDEQGQPIYDENQKIMKGPNYRPADLARFV